MTIAQEAGGARKSGLLDWVRPQSAVILLGILSVAWHGALPLNHDVAWIWEGAGRLLDGGRFGRDVVDVNPPLAWWLTLLPFAFSRATGLPASVSMSAFIVAIGIGAILISLRVVSPRLSDGKVWVVGLVAAWALFLLPGYDFGQREHMMAALALPYLCAAALRAERQPLSPDMALAAGILGGVGFCLKPYFFLIPLLVEAWLWLRTRGLAAVRIEPIAMVLVGVAYLVAVFLFAPDYLNRVAPDAAIGYGAYGAAPGLVTLQFLLDFVPVLIGVGLVIIANSESEKLLLAQCFLVSAAGAAAAYLVQSKGWSYHMLPAFVFGSMAAAAAFHVQTRSKLPLAVVGLAIVIFLGARGAVAQFTDADGTRARVTELSAIFRTAANGKVFAFITSPRDIHPAIVDSGTTWIADAGGLYLLPASVEAENAPVTPRSLATVAAGTRQAQATISQLIQSVPALVAVDDKPTKLGFGALRFEYLHYFLGDPRFARFWRGYREMQPAGGFRMFRCISCRKEGQ